MGSMDNFPGGPARLLNFGKEQKEGKKTELTRPTCELIHINSIIDEEKEEKKTEPPGATGGPVQKISIIDEEKEADESQQIAEQTDRGHTCKSMAEPAKRH